jgi:YHS domain-containing protein
MEDPMRTLMLLALPLLLLSCDSKEEPKAHDHSMHDAPAASADKAKDPVCGMMIDKAKATKHTHEGADYFFCADACLAKFKAEPKKYAVHCSCAGMKRACACDHCGGKDPCDCTK